MGGDGGGQAVPVDEPQLGPWERRRLRVAHTIEVAGVRLIARAGYSNVTVADIARAAGVSPATVARYFPLKEDILLAVPRASRRRTLDAMAGLVGSQTPLTDMVREWQRLAGEYEDRLGEFDEWIQAVRTAPEIQAKALGEDLHALSEPLTALCAEALGVDPAQDMRPMVLAAALIAANEAHTRFWSAGGRTQGVSELLEIMLGTLVRDLPTL